MIHFFGFEVIVLFKIDYIMKIIQLANVSKMILLIEG